MISKKHEAIAFYLLVTSLLALVIVSITFRYYLPDETFLFDDDLLLYTSETVSYNGTLFDFPQHIYKISISNASYPGDPLIDPSVNVIINDDFKRTLNGPDDYVVYNTKFNGRINECVLTDAGLAVSFQVEFSALRDRNPTYISLTTVTCILSLYYFYIATKLRKEKKEAITEEAEIKPAK